MVGIKIDLEKLIFFGIELTIRTYIYFNKKVFNIN